MRRKVTGTPPRSPQPGANESSPCRDKLGQCGAFKIQADIVFVVAPNPLARVASAALAAANVTYRILTNDLSVSGVAAPNGSSHLITFRAKHFGTHVLAVFAGGPSAAPAQLPGSPVLFQVTELTCTEEPGLVPDASGAACVAACAAPRVQLGAWCVSDGELLAAVLVPAAAIAAAVYFSCRLARAEEDELRAAAAALRTRLRLEPKYGFFLASEWLNLRPPPPLYTPFSIFCLNLPSSVRVYRCLNRT